MCGYCGHSYRPTLVCIRPSKSCSACIVWMAVNICKRPYSHILLSFALFFTGLRPMFHHVVRLKPRVSTASCLERSDRTTSETRTKAPSPREARTKRRLPRLLPLHLPNPRQRQAARRSLLSSSRPLQIRPSLPPALPTRLKTTECHSFCCPRVFLALSNPHFCLFSLFICFSKFFLSFFIALLVFLSSFTQPVFRSFLFSFSLFSS